MGSSTSSGESESSEIGGRGEGSSVTLKFSSSLAPKEGGVGKPGASEEGGDSGNSEMVGGEFNPSSKLSVGEEGGSETELSWFTCPYF